MCTILPHFFNGRLFVYALTSDKNRTKKLAYSKVCQFFSLPCLYRVKNLIWLCFVNFFTEYCYYICSRFAGGLVIKPENFLVAGCGNFAEIFGNFHFGNNRTVLLNRRKLVHTAENWFCTGCDQAFAD